MTKVQMPPAARAAVLVFGPMLFAALLLVLTDRGAPASGVFVEGERGVMFAVSSYLERRELDFSDIATKAIVIPSRPPLSFYVIAPAGESLAATADAASVYRIVVDHAAPNAAVDAERVTAAVHQINPRTIRVDPPAVGWGDRASTDQYARVLALTPGSRATIDLIVALVVPDRTKGTLRVFPIRVGSS